MKDFELIYRILHFFRDWGNGNHTLKDTIFDVSKFKIPDARFIAVLTTLQNTGFIKGYDDGVPLYLHYVEITQAGLYFLENSKAIRKLAKKIHKK